eukprot:TRINITY_DN7068_c0_g2_i1.p2 TRINITY_DN7068_c0_g2~~TRINITY_DN7068_c0_g2_i1.p2  ORF type:complete len:103 (+),score=8.64 TRINITY_DN7068_c0_g2_i1:381-689(+)
MASTKLLAVPRALRAAPRRPAQLAHGASGLGAQLQLMPPQCAAAADAASTSRAPPRSAVADAAREPADASEAQLPCPHEHVRSAVVTVPLGHVRMRIGVSSA